MRKITLKITISEFWTLESFVRLQYEYVHSTDLNLVTDAQLIIADFYPTILTKTLAWQIKNSAIEHKIEIPFITARIIGKELIVGKVDFLMQNLINKLDKALVNNNYSLFSQFDGQKIQVFS